MIRIRSIILIVMLAATLAGSAAMGQEATAPVSPPAVEPTLQAMQAQMSAAMAETARAADSAADASASSESLIARVDMLLSFLEVLSGVAALAIAGLAIFGLTSLRDLRKNLRESFEEDRAKLEEQGKRDRAQFEELRRQLDSQLDQVKNANSLAEQVRHQGDRAIRALTLVQLGEQQLRDSNWLAAQKTFEEAYRLDDRNRAVNYFLGELYIMQRELGRAEEHLRRSQIDVTHGEEDDIQQIYPPAEAALAYVLRLQGDKETDISSRNEYYASAERRFLKALRFDPNVRDINDESVNGMLGALYRQWGRFEDAIRAYEKAARVTPNRSYPLNNLAMLYYMRGDTDKSTPRFLQAIKLADVRIAANPNDYWAHFDKITGQLACTLTAEAKASFDDVLATVQIEGPLESFRNGLRVMYSSGRNTSEDVQEFITRVEAKLQQMKHDSHKPDGPAPTGHAPTDHRPTDPKHPHA